MIKKTKHFVNYAHRGASAYAPENTLAAFYLGLAQGANGIETDIQRTADGRLVLFHDDRLDRLTGLAGTVADYTWEELAVVLVEIEPKAVISRDRLILLDTFLRHFAFRGLTLAIEMKARGLAADVLQATRRFGVHEECIYTSFWQEDLEEVRALDSSARLAFLCREVDASTLAFVRGLAAEQICLPSEKLTPELVAELQDGGLTVRAWGVKDESSMVHAVRCGVAGGMTVDFPDRLTEYLAGEVLKCDDSLS